MKHKKLLLILADFLSKLDESTYDMMSHDKGPLAYAAKLPEFRAAGWTMAVNDNDPPVGVKQPTYNGMFDLSAAVEFFDITGIEAQYLFSSCEFDLWGYSATPIHGTDRKDFKNARDHEPPQFTAARIRAFVNNPGEDCLGRTQSETA